MRNTLGDLNNYLFESLERLSEDDMTDAELEKEITRANAVTKVASQIISNANIVLQAKKLQADTSGRENTEIPKMLEG